MFVCVDCKSEVENLVPRSKKCKSCYSKYLKQWRKDNLTKERSNQYYKNHYSNPENREKHHIRTNKYVSENREYYQEYNKKWFQDNKESRSEYQKNKRLLDNMYKISSNVRTRINNAVKTFILDKKDKSLELLGCNIKEYIIYLESKFAPEMNWDNYGNYWEIDHIMPLSKGGSFHFTNTQPLTINENRSKGNRI